MLTDFQVKGILTERTNRLARLVNTEIWDGNTVWYFNIVRSIAAAEYSSEINSHSASEETKRLL